MKYPIVSRGMKISKDTIHGHDMFFLGKNGTFEKLYITPCQLKALRIMIQKIEFNDKEITK